MPGVFTARSQAKWLEKKAKLEKKVKKKEEKKETREDIIDSQVERRKKAFESQKKKFKKRRYETLLTKLIEQKKKNIDRSPFRFRFRELRRWILFTDINDNYIDYDEYYRKPMANEEFEKKLARELKFELESLEDDFIEEFYDEFERTVNRTDFIKDEFMLALTKKNCIKACLTIKEELMATAWHPDRVSKWLNAGRYIGDVDGEPQHDFSVLNMMAGYDSD